MATIEELRTKAAEIELHAVDFLDAEGRYVSGGNGRELHHIDFTFIDGVKLTIDHADKDRIDDITFRLVPKRADA